MEEESNYSINPHYNNTATKLSLNESLKDFKISFCNYSGKQVGELIIPQEGGLRFHGDIEESANIFFNYLKNMIDAYIVDETIKRKNDDNV